MLRYLIAGLFLFQTGCVSVDKSFSNNKETLKSFCNQVMEASDIKKSDREYKREYSKCLVSSTHTAVGKEDTKARMIGGAILMSVYLLAAKFLFFDVKPSSK